MGIQVAKNVKALRGRVPVRELSEQLGAIGRPMLPSAITKIETGQRRVDVDDLVALAEVLDVAPQRLLVEGTDLDEARMKQLEDEKAFGPVLAAVRTLVDDEHVPLDDLFEYLKLAERMRAVFADVPRTRKD